MRQVLAALVTAGLLAAVPVAAHASPTPKPKPCTLILSAMPLELAPIISQATLDAHQPVSSQGREFYQGTIGTHRVVMGLTGIGPANATATTKAALAAFPCVTLVTFSGVAGAGGRSAIGDVTIPTRWSTDDGKTWTYADAPSVALAGRVARSVHLEEQAALGDPTCSCVPADAIKFVTLTHRTGMVVGGDGSTTDPFGGHMAPCVPGGTDVDACAPCPVVLHEAPDTQPFVHDAPQIPQLLSGLASPTDSTTHVFVAYDEETGAVAKVASAHHVKWIGFRGISDGTPDPLGLPGFPSQFVVYKQIAAENSAIMALAFLRAT